MWYLLCLGIGALLGVAGAEFGGMLLAKLKSKTVAELDKLK